MRKFLSFILLCSVATLFCNAQTDLFPARSLNIAISADAFAGLEFSYNQRFEIAHTESQANIHFQTPLLLDIKHHSVNALELGVSVENRTISNGRFLLLSETGINAMYHHQVLGDFYPLTLQLKATPALQTKTGYVGLQLGYRQTLANYIRFSDYTRARFSEIYDTFGHEIAAKPENGFYNLTGHRFEIGIAGKFLVSNKNFICYEAGYCDYLSRYTSAFDGMMFGQLPFFMKIKFGFTLQ
ncbi:MAG: hypothetical protein QM800_04465 [Paludibacter sp.]